MLTLISESMAREGMKFVFEGPDEVCATCKLRFTCLSSLDKGRVYEITAVKKTKHFCPREDGYLVLVEIAEPKLTFALSSRRAIAGMTVEYHPPCDRAFCQHYDECVAVGLSEGEKAVILAVKGPVDCPLSPSKRIVEVRRLQG